MPEPKSQFDTNFILAVMDGRRELTKEEAGYLCQELFDARVAKTRAMEVAAYLASCSVVTLEMLKSRKSSPKSEVRRYVGICKKAAGMLNYGTLRGGNVFTNTDVQSTIKACLEAVEDVQVS